MIHLAWCFDRHYRQHAAASVMSLLMNCTADGTRLHLHLVTDAVDADFEARVDRLRGAFKARIDLLQVGDRLTGLLERLPTRNAVIPSMSRMTWARVLLAEILPEVDRLLYLDADTIVTGDISVLWGVDLQGAPVGAVADASARTMRARLGLPQYVNSGVMLMDLALWRAQRLSQAAIECASREAERIVFADQCTINLLLADRIRLLDPRWNMFATIRNRDADFSQAQIIHFITSDKPWQAWYENPVGRLYWRYLEVSPWNDARPTAPTTPAQLVRMARLLQSQDTRARQAGLYEDALRAVQATRPPDA